MKAYIPPKLTSHGNLTTLTRADFTNSSTDSYFDADGNPLNIPGLTGSGPGCVDSNRNGVCDYKE